MIGLVIAVAPASPSLAAPAATTATSCPPVTTGALNAAPSVPGTSKTVAFTFDDGPGRSTQAIITILEAFHVRATFFNIGWDTGWYPALVREEVADGFLVGDHTNSHPDMALLSAPAQTEEMTQVINRQRALTVTSPCVFRPPYGDYNATTLRIANQLGMSLWMWNVGGGDWEANGSGSPQWVRFIEGNAINGAKGQNHPVILLHNQAIAMPATVAALPTIIRSFLQHGYTFVDLLGRSGPPNSCGTTSVAPPAPSFTALASGTTLRPGQVVESPHGQYALRLTSRGQLVYAATSGGARWSSPVTGSSGVQAVLANGALSIETADGTVLWTTAANGSGAATLDVNADGTLTLRGATGVIWRTTDALTALTAGQSLRPGWYISSSNLRCQLRMRSDGSLALLAADGQRLWYTRALPGAQAATLLPTGNLVVTSATGAVLWSTALSSHDHDQVVVTNHGTVVVLTHRRVPVWVTQ